jgi:release factor glutamine methyltransferase
VSRWPGDTDDLPAEISLDAALHWAAAHLARAGIVTSRADAELLAASVLGLSRGETAARALTGVGLSADQRDRFAELAGQRADRIPLQHLTGRAAFRTLELRVGPGVFVPRPETEVVAGLAIDEARRVVEQRGQVLVVDLCTGSGAIACAVAAEVPMAHVIAVELSPQACAWAEANLADLSLTDRVDLRCGDAVRAEVEVLSDLVGRVDVVVSNPPYIPPGARPVDPEVAEHDPPVALFGGGPDGLAVPAGVVTAARALLVERGLLVMEHAEAQARATRALAPTPDWSGTRTESDLTGRPRALLARHGSGDARLSP